MTENIAVLTAIPSARAATAAMVKLLVRTSIRTAYFKSLKIESISARNNAPHLRATAGLCGFAQLSGRPYSFAISQCLDVFAASCSDNFRPHPLCRAQRILERLRTAERFLRLSHVPRRAAIPHAGLDRSRRVWERTCERADVVRREQGLSSSPPR